MDRKKHGVFILLILCLLISGCNQPSKQPLFEIGQEWATDGNTFTVKEVTAIDSYTTPDNKLYSPGEDSVFLMVRYSITLSDGWAMSSDAKLRIASFSNTYNSFCDPIPVDGDEYVLLFRLNEQTYAANAGDFSLDVEMSQSEQVKRIATFRLREFDA